MLLNFLQYMEWSSTTKNYLAPKVCSAELEKPWGAHVEGILLAEHELSVCIPCAQSSLRDLSNYLYFLLTPMTSGIVISLNVLFFPHHRMYFEIKFSEHLVLIEAFLFIQIYFLFSHIFWNKTHEYSEWSLVK